MKLYDYECITTFWQDFSIADAFGRVAIQDTFDRAFSEWKHNIKYLTELVMVLNHKTCQWYQHKDYDLSVLYERLWSKAASYVIEHFTGEDLQYYYSVTD